MATILETVVDSDDFDLLEAAVIAAGLDDDVAALDGATVFAPTDAAFRQTAVDLGFEGDDRDGDGDADDDDDVFAFIAELAEDIGDGDLAAGLTAILTYHIVPDQELSTRDIRDLTTIDTLSGVEIGSADGQATLIDQDETIADPRIVARNIDADNGTIQAIDRVLLPADVEGNDGEAPEDDLTIAETVVAAADDGEFELLLAGVQATGLDAPLADPEGTFTVFAPTDEAFVELAEVLGFEGDEEDEANEDNALAYILDVLEVLGQGDALGVLEDILLYHVVGEELDSTAVIAADGGTITPLLGVEVGVDVPELVDQSPDIENPELNLDNLDIGASNGIIHEIDGVLLPVAIAGDTNVVIGTDEDDRLIGTIPEVTVIEDSDEEDLGDGEGSLPFFGIDLAFDGAPDVVNAGGGDDFVQTFDADDQVFGGTGDDFVLAGDGDDVVSGGGGADNLLGNRGDDVLAGGANNDRLRGGTGDDDLEGNGGRDRIVGGRGDDTIDGGIGNDVLAGNNGADRFEFVDGDGIDRIRGFRAEDTLAISSDEVVNVIEVNARTLQVQYGDDDIITVHTNLSADELEANLAFL